ncbi:MAG TPA: hypothetical protein VGR54_03255 [Nitrosopumilaceae archaeon]|nr:hypothetical protein [Nitrosopumilaceae archaeon]
MLENLLANSEYHALDNSSFEPFIFASKIVSLVLALFVTVYAYNFYKIFRSLVLLGLILGFGFMALADILMIITIPVHKDPILFNLFFWMRLFVSAYGFTFLALSYHCSTKERGKANSFVLKISILSVIPVFAMLTWFSNSSIFPPFTNYDEYFRVYNICALGYVFIKSLQYSVSKVRKDFMYLTIAYGILWMGTFSLLFFTLDGSLSAVVASYVAKDVGLAIFVIMIYCIGKDKSSLKTGVKTSQEI